MGAVSCYTWLYFAKYPHDRWTFKLLVTACFLMCAADTAGTGVWVYDWAVAGYASDGTCSTMVQIFYAWRVWLVSTRKNWIIPIAIVTLSVLGWCIVCWMVSIMVTHKLVSELSLVSPTVYVWLGGSVGADVLITCSMVYYLDLRFRMKEATRPTHANNRFREIIYRTVECNVLSLLAQSVSVGLFNSPSVGFYFGMRPPMSSRLLALTLHFAVLGRREDGLSGARNMSSKSAEQYALSERRVMDNRVANTQVSINVQRETTDDRSDQDWNKPNDEFEQCQKVRLPV
ncbi:hypothetical protein FB451DRAFT_1206561 [Mycena latifolia]|nr:hypothetical protein FB451DRAFT_1206561 [Mycena latifolia]